MQTKKIKLKGTRSLLRTQLERVSKDVFRKYFPLITELVGNSPGVYALYDENELYYVGKSADLKKRVRHHLKDRHLSSWTHFSLYLVRKEDHIHEIESLLIRISNPKGNRMIPRGKSSGSLLKQLKNMIRVKQRNEFDFMFGRKKKISTAYVKLKKSLVGLVRKIVLLFRTYKNVEYKAYLNGRGTIRYKNRVYDSPTGAAKAIVKRGAINGWHFWYIKNRNGDWVKLNDFVHQ